MEVNGIMKHIAVFGFAYFEHDTIIRSKAINHELKSHHCSARKVRPSTFNGQVPKIVSMQRSPERLITLEKV